MDSSAGEIAADHARSAVLKRKIDLFNNAYRRWAAAS